MDDGARVRPRRPPRPPRPPRPCATPPRRRSTRRHRGHLHGAGGAVARSPRRCSCTRSRSCRWSACCHWPRQSSAGPPWATVGRRGHLVLAPARRCGRPRVYDDVSVIVLALLGRLWHLSTRELCDWLERGPALALAYCLEAFERRGALSGRIAPAGGSPPAATAQPGPSPGTDDELAVLLRSLGYARSLPLDLPWQLPGVLQTSLERRLREGLLRPEELADQVARAIEQLLTPARRPASITGRA